MSSQQQLSRMTKNELKKWLTKHNQRLPREERLKSFYLSRAKDYLAKMKKQTEAKKSSKKAIMRTPKSTAKRIVRTKRRHSNVVGSSSKNKNHLSSPSAQKSVRSRKKLIPRRKTPTKKSPNALAEIRKKRARVRRATLDPMAIEAILNENEQNNEDEPQEPELTSGDSENGQKLTPFCQKYELYTDPSSMTISELRSWLQAHNIDFEISGQRKQYYVDLVDENSIVKQSNKPNFSASPPAKRYKTTPPSDKEKDSRTPMPENLVHSPLSPPKNVTRLLADEEHNKYKENIRENGPKQFASPKLLEKSRGHGLLSTPVINKKSIQINSRSKKQMRDEILSLLDDDDDDQDDDYMQYPITAKKITKQNVGEIEPPKGNSIGQTPAVLKYQHSLFTEMVKKMSPNKYSHVFSSGSKVSKDEAPKMFDDSNAATDPSQNRSPETFHQQVQQPDPTPFNGYSKKLQFMTAKSKKEHHSSRVMDEDEPGEMARHPLPPQEFIQQQKHYANKSKLELEDEYDDDQDQDQEHSESEEIEQYGNNRNRDYEYEQDEYEQDEDNDNDNDNENYGSLQRHPPISRIEHKKNMTSNAPALQDSPQYYQQNLSPMRMPYENRSFSDAQSADLVHNAPIPKSRKKKFGLLLIISLLVAAFSVFITKFDGMVHINKWKTEFGKHQVQLSTIVTDYISDLTFRLTPQPTLFCDPDSKHIESYQTNRRHPVECVQCPENALTCKNGILKCKETYLIRGTQCIRDSKIIRYAYDIEQQASMILSELNGKKECGEDIDISIRAPELKALVSISNDNMFKESFEYFRIEILPHSQNIRLNKNHRFYSTKSIKSVSCMAREWAFKNALFIGGITAMFCFLACVACRCKRRQWINDEIKLLSTEVYDLLEEQRQINQHEFMPVDRVKQALRPTTNAIWDKVEQIITKDSNIQKSMRMVDGLQKKCWKLSASLLPSLNASINYGTGTGASSNATRPGSANSSNQARSLTNGHLPPPTGYTPEDFSNRHNFHVNANAPPARRPGQPYQKTNNNSWWSPSRSFGFSPMRFSAIAENKTASAIPIHNMMNSSYQQQNQSMNSSMNSSMNQHNQSSTSISDENNNRGFSFGANNMAVDADDESEITSFPVHSKESNRRNLWSWNR